MKKWKRKTRKKKENGIKNTQGRKLETGRRGGRKKERNGNVLLFWVRERGDF